MRLVIIARCWLLGHQYRVGGVYDRAVRLECTRSLCGDSHIYGFDGSTVYIGTQQFVPLVHGGPGEDAKG